jgi:hypothetical protein
MRTVTVALRVGEGLDTVAVQWVAAVTGGRVVGAVAAGAVVARVRVTGPKHWTGV